MHPAKQLLRLLLGERLPITSGVRRVRGLARDVVIRRDRWDIPHIDAAGERDAWYAVGFCHAQDRGFQLEVLVRLIRGTLAEVAGRELVDLDRLSRRLGFLRVGSAGLPLLGSRERETVEAYAAGVNAGHRYGRKRRSHEFVLLRTKPSAWTGGDVAGALALQSFLLAANWDTELARLKIMLEDGPEAVAELDPEYAHWHPVTAPVADRAGPALDHLIEDLEHLRELSGLTGASNNWALNARKTATGRPLLANDPHLAPLLPPHWYLTHVRTPEWEVAGATFVGSPGVPAGHNGFAAWGVTAGLADNTDLWIEKLGADGRSVMTATGNAPCEVRTELIRVRGADPVTEEVLATERGPIISPALEHTDVAISLQATWLRPGPVRGLLSLHRSTSFDDFRRRWDAWPGATLNMVYADETDTIGWQLGGHVPRRRRGSGAIPLPAWDPAHGWEPEWVPFEEMPSTVNPDVGYVATANNRPIAAAEPFLGIDFIDGYRVGRIQEMLAAHDDWDVPTTMAAQTDVVSLPWREIRDSVLGALLGRERLAEARRLLTDWDGRVTAESRGAALYELMTVDLYRRVADAKAPRAAPFALGKGFTRMVPFNLLVTRRASHLTRLLRERPPGWFPGTWNEVVAASVETAWRSLQKHDNRRWGWVRPLTLRHTIGEANAALGAVFNLGPFPWGGDANTVAQAGVDLNDAGGNPPGIASMRMVVDVGRWEDARFVLPGGQSGNPFSPHYDDMLELWKHGEGVPIAWSEEAVATATASELRLVAAQ